MQQNKENHGKFIKLNIQKLFCFGICAMSQISVAELIVVNSTGNEKYLDIVRAAKKGYVRPVEYGRAKIREGAEVSYEGIKKITPGKSFTVPYHNDEIGNLVGITIYGINPDQDLSIAERADMAKKSVTFSFKKTPIQSAYSEYAIRNTALEIVPEDKEKPEGAFKINDKTKEIRALAQQPAQEARVEVEGQEVIIPSQSGLRSIITDYLIGEDEKPKKESETSAPAGSGSEGDQKNSASTSSGSRCH